MKELRLDAFSFLQLFDTMHLRKVKILGGNLDIFWKGPHAKLNSKNSLFYETLCYDTALRLYGALSISIPGKGDIFPGF